MANNDPITTELDALRAQLARETDYRKNVEAAFKRLLFAVEQQNAIINPTIQAFDGMKGKKGFAATALLPQIINKVMGMLDEEKTKVIMEVSKNDIHPILAQYVAFYRAKEANE